MSQTNIAQINARLPRELKESGDRGLQTLGISPTTAIRILWTRLSSGGEDLVRVKDFLLGEAGETLGEDAASFNNSDVVEGWRLVERGIEQLNITAKPETIPWTSQDDKDLVAQALEERMREKGVDVA